MVSKNNELIGDWIIDPYDEVSINVLGLIYLKFPRW
jgi:hypothetical protein